MENVKEPFQRRRRMYEARHTETQGLGYTQKESIQGQLIVRM